MFHHGNFVKESYTSFAVANVVRNHRTWTLLRKLPEKIEDMGVVTFSKFQKQITHLNVKSSNIWNRIGVLRRKRPWLCSLDLIFNIVCEYKGKLLQSPPLSVISKATLYYVRILKNYSREVNFSRGTFVGVVFVVLYLIKQILMHATIFLSIQEQKSAFLMFSMR